jgi:hypothetical protein
MTNLDPSSLKRVARTVLLGVTALLACVAVAHAAAPKSGTFKSAKGQIQLGYDFRFTVDKGGKRISKVVAHVLESCDGSSTSSTTTVGPKLTWTVTGGKFAGRKKERYDGVTVYTTLQGSFTSPTVAKGIVRQETIVAGSVCDTRKLKFTAKLAR